MVYVAYSIGVDIELTVTKTEQMLTGPGRLLRPVEPARIPSEGTALQPRVLFCYKNRKSRRHLVFIVPSEPVIECHPRGQGSCNLMVARSCER